MTINYIVRLLVNIKLLNKYWSIFGFYKIKLVQMYQHFIINCSFHLDRNLSGNLTNIFQLNTIFMFFILTLNRIYLKVITLLLQ